MDAESSVSQRYWGPNKYGRERGLSPRDFTVGTRIVRPFTETEYEFCGSLKRIINVRKQGHTWAYLLLESCCLFPDATIFCYFLFGHGGTLEAKYRSTVPGPPLGQNASHGRLRNSQLRVILFYKFNCLSDCNAMFLIVLPSFVIGGHHNARAHETRALHGSRFFPWPSWTSLPCLHQPYFTTST
jgi:hypothetical protein